MDSLLPLNIFPPGGLESSVITAVLVGVWVIVFLNLRFGFTLAGLVVPGYLVPLIFVKPISAAVVVFEGVITYFLAYFFANRLMVMLRWGEMFGRDRFFALILISVLVRILFDFFILPDVGAYIDQNYFQFDYQNHMQSFGLIIVALIANQLWNGGFFKGAAAFGTYIVITYAIMAWVLIPYTNFSVAGLNYMYEDLATSLLSSPKAYIIVLTTAFIASRFNLKYGWDFNGILIPSLLALQWYQPEKLLFTFVEAGVILFLGKGLLSLPAFKHSNFEGSKLLLLFFNIGFMYKLILGYALIAWIPSAKITDYYGFGYIVSTLIAIKFYEKHIAIQMIRTTVQTSFVSVLLASLVGFLLTFSTYNLTPAPSVKRSSVVLDAVEDYRNTYNNLKFESFNDGIEIQGYAPRSLESFRTILQNAIKESGNPGRFMDALMPMSDMGIDIQRHPNDIVSLYLTGVGFYVIDMKQSDGLLLEAPRARTAIGTDLLALQLFEHLNAKAVLLDLSLFDSTAASVRYDSLRLDGYFQTLHKLLSGNDTLQIWGEWQDPEQRRLRERDSNYQSVATLEIKNQKPRSLSIAQLNQWFPDLVVNFDPKAPNNLQKQYDLYGFSKLHLPRRHINSLLVRLELLDEARTEQLQTNFDQYLLQWLANYKEGVARRGSESYARAEVSELKYWDSEIITPLLSWVNRFEVEGWTTDAEQELQRISYVLSGFGYRISHSTIASQQQEYLLIHEDLEHESRRHWPAFVINLNAKSDLFVQVPNPFYENTSLEFGVSLFEYHQARYLLLAGSHPLANRDESSNVTKLGNRFTLFNLFHQVVVREHKQGHVMPVQIRGYSFQPHRPFPKESVLVSIWQEIQPSVQNPLLEQITDFLDHLSLSHRIANGDETTSAYYFSNNQQSSYLNYSKASDFASLWLSPLVRTSFKMVHEENRTETHMRSLGVAIDESPLRDLVVFGKTCDMDKWTDLYSELTEYAATRNIQLLHHAANNMGRQGLRYVIDAQSRQDFLMISDAVGTTCGVINLATFSDKEFILENDRTVDEFVSSRSLWLRRPL